MQTRYWLVLIIAVALVASGTSLFFFVRRTRSNATSHESAKTSIPRQSSLEAHKNSPRGLVDRVIVQLQIEDADGSPIVGAMVVVGEPALGLRSIANAEGKTLSGTGGNP